MTLFVASGRLKKFLESVDYSIYVPTPEYFSSLIIFVVMLPVRYSRGRQVVTDRCIVCRRRYWRGDSRA